MGEVAGEFTLDEMHMEESEGDDKVEDEDEGEGEGEGEGEAASKIKESDPVWRPMARCLAVLDRFWEDPFAEPFLYPGEWYGWYGWRNSNGLKIYRLLSDIRTIRLSDTSQCDILHPTEPSRQSIPRSLRTILTS